ncbi:hypothetical protein [Roseateles asaccharophilus]|uniref:Uncharacterized protein n=1 Tax=Roseateles asaccharophilus TaxID=582607 RepID=A0ABU2A343_9BURK|nr:hypothetical protein [Roseateles asaccharophilus]MDR7331584.1 hypothetical protein [Roseateles asaccharophilus]
MATASYFSSEDNHTTLRRFHREIESIKIPDRPTPDVTTPLGVIIRIMTHNGIAFDQHCAVNIEWIGDHFFAQIRDYLNKTDKETLLSIFTAAYRFICELEFSQEGELSMELRGAKSFVDENIEEFPHQHRRQLVYANYLTPISITKKIINSPALVEFKAFTQTALAAKTLKEKWDQELAERDAQIETFRSGLSKIQTAYNFVGLVKGFEALAKEKRREKLRAFLSTIALGFVMILPVAAQLWISSNLTNTIDLHRSVLLYSLPTLALELILLYFFRIVLINYKNCTNQLLQIDLCITLCQFIQSYSEYSTKIKKDDASALEKFENLIFSAITPEAGAIPSTLDGVEQIAKLVSSIRNK